LSEVKTISVHLGASRVATEILECVSREMAESILGKSKKIISQKEYTIFLRSHINAPGNSVLDHVKSKIGLEDYLSNLDQFAHVVSSQHAMLGKTSDIFAESEILPKARRRVENFCRIFADRQINIHLAIAPLHDCLITMASEDEGVWKAEKGTYGVNSWSNLVSHITAACPAANFTIWDFEDPDAVSLSFLASLLGLHVDQVDEVTRSNLHSDACENLKRAKLLSKIVVVNEPLQALMDEQYELDLLNISEMRNVSLVSPK
jgi:hypothetical protein